MRAHSPARRAATDASFLTNVSPLSGPTAHPSKPSSLQHVHHLVPPTETLAAPCPALPSARHTPTPQASTFSARSQPCSVVGPTPILACQPGQRHPRGGQPTAPLSSHPAGTETPKPDVPQSQMHPKPNTSQSQTSPKAKRTPKPDIPRSQTSPEARRPPKPDVP